MLSRRGRVGIAVEHGVDVVEVDTGLGFSAPELSVSVLVVDFLAAAQAQALAGLAESKLDTG